jgi:hypothetical protein
MAGRNSWTSPVNALLDGVESTEGADTDAPETDYGSPWARALREIMERHTGVRADDLRFVAPYQPSPPQFGQPSIINPQWPRTFDTEPSPGQIISSSFLRPPGWAEAMTPAQSTSAYASKFPQSFPYEMPDSDVTATPLMAEGSGQFTPRPSSTTPAPIPVHYQDTERRWPGGGGLPTPWDTWYDGAIKGIGGLIHSFRSTRGASTPRGGDDDYCVNRWENEWDRCKYRDEKWRPDCRRRAGVRLDQCVRYNGKPPNEPPEWSKADEEERFNPRR